VKIIGDREMMIHRVHTNRNKDCTSSADKNQLPADTPWPARIIFSEGEV